MSDRTSIEWTNATWNPVRGCTKVSPGCAHCYAETFAERFRGVQGHPYEQGFDLRLVPDKLTEPLRWNKPRRVFVNSMSDLFQDGVPDDYIARVFAVMALTPRHTYQVLTKRPERMRAFISRESGHFGTIWSASFGIKPAPPPEHWYHVGRSFAWPLPNVWLGVSVENQHFADERIPLLLQTPAAVRFLSCEPLLERVQIPHIDLASRDGARGYIHWVIVGGESGPGARRCSAQWIRSIVRQCGTAGVPVFVKQLGANVIDRNDAGFDGGDPRSWPERDRDDIEEHIHGYREDWQGADVRVRLRDRKGSEMAEWPRDLRVRQWPRVLA